MPELVELETPRLRLRAWRDEDKEPFALMNSDPRVMECFPGLLDRAASDAFVERIGIHMAEHGWGLWAVALRSTDQFIGFTGLRRELGLPCSPCYEAGWRLAHAYWGQGYASEAALAALEFGFGTLGVDEIVAVTALPNLRSQAVMRRIGMCLDLEREFDHPRVPAGHWLQRHCLYSIDRAAWRGRRAG